MVKAVGRVLCGDVKTMLVLKLFKKMLVLKLFFIINLFGQ